MRTGDDIPHSQPDQTLDQVLVEMSSKGMGFTVVVDHASAVRGVFTDGDLRRTLDNNTPFRDTAVSRAMTAHCCTVTPQTLAAEALRVMETRSINALPVVDDSGKLCGALNMHDLLRAGVA